MDGKVQIGTFQAATLTTDLVSVQVAHGVAIRSASAAVVSYDMMKIWVFGIIWPLLTAALIVIVVRQHVKIRKLGGGVSYGRSLGLALLFLILASASVLYILCIMMLIRRWCYGL